MVTFVLFAGIVGAVAGFVGLSFCRRELTLLRNELQAQFVLQRDDLRACWDHLACVVADIQRLQRSCDNAFAWNSKLALKMTLLTCELQGKVGKLYQQLQLHEIRLQWIGVKLRRNRRQ